MQENSRFQAARQALRLLFSRPGNDRDLEYGSPLAGQLAAIFRCFDESEKSNADAVDYLNQLKYELKNRNLGDELAAGLFDALVRHGVLPTELVQEKWSEDTVFLLNRALKIVKALKMVPAALPEPRKTELLPAAQRMLESLPDCPDEAALAALLVKQDIFLCRNAFLYDGREFRPVELSAVKPVEEFYGFPSVRAEFQDHFRDFASGRSNLPLLINSLPGYGKTSMTVSHAMALPGLVLILPTPEVLEHHWNALIDQLASRPDRKFVVFFDDIDPREIDWYLFRTNVGGAFAPPENILPVLAANYEFPASILSRGRKLSYPVFDELRCQEMIEEFLISKFKMQKPSRNLISLIGAGYCEEFGQKKFTELSPRSLIRHLKSYEHDQIKRKTVVEMSFGKLIFKPDAQLFYDFNIELMRSLYGEEYIQRLLKEQLRNLEK